MPGKISTQFLGRTFCIYVGHRLHLYVVSKATNKGKYGHIECEAHFIVFLLSLLKILVDPLMADIHQARLLHRVRQ